jgi:hypothetical protein
VVINLIEILKGILMLLLLKRNHFLCFGALSFDAFML